jgi:hypothetical protein
LAILKALMIKQAHNLPETILTITASTTSSFSCPYACVCHGMARRQSLFV